MYWIIAFIISIIIAVTSTLFYDARVITGGSGSIQDKVAIEYKSLKLPRKTMSFDDFCFPSKFKLQNPQKFIGEYMSRNDVMNLLGFHRIGAGKTCAAITAAEKYTGGSGKPLVLMPASLVPGFYNELRSPCAGTTYISIEDRNELAGLSPGTKKYKEIVQKSNILIDEKYDIMSYNRFITADKSKLDPPLMIIDEVQNINNPSGVVYKMAKRFIDTKPHMRLLVLSATPIFDHVGEFVHLLRLMRQNVPDNITDDPSQLRKAVNGLVSYYAGAPTYTFPTTTIHYKICKMSQFQSRWYKSEVQAEQIRTGTINLRAINNSFYIKSRAKSNIVFPKGLSGTDGLPKLSKAKILSSLSTYSTKFCKLIKMLKKGQLAFVYTNFTSFGGIKSVLKCLRVFGFTNYSSGSSGRRYALWTGEQTPREKDAIRSIFNSSANNDGSQIQFIIGSPAIKEGVSLLRVREVHILEPYWNHSRLEQIYGRAVRFCSHKSLPRAQRTVDIYIYIAITSDSKIKMNGKDRDITPLESIDAYQIQLANQKREEVNKVLDIVIESAVDKKLNQ
jgi:hypothetical protein